MILANCARMNIQPSEARQLTLHDYQALVHNWNLTQDGGEEELEPPSLEKIAERQARLEARGIKVLH